MNIHDLGIVKKILLKDLSKESEKTFDEYRNGVQTGLEIAISEVDRLMEHESEKMSSYYGEDE
mgnify:CR=1 FL=1